MFGCSISHILLPIQDDIQSVDLSPQSNFFPLAASILDLHQRPRRQRARGDGHTSDLRNDADLDAHHHLDPNGGGVTTACHLPAVGTVTARAGNSAKVGADSQSVARAPLARAERDAKEPRRRTRRRDQSRPPPAPRRSRRPPRRATQHHARPTTDQRRAAKRGRSTTPGLCFRRAFGPRNGPSTLSRPITKYRKKRAYRGCFVQTKTLKP